MHQLTPLALKQGEKQLCPKPQTERSGIAVSETMNRSPSLQANHVRHQCNSLSVTHSRNASQSI
jgi:hypothetical protein